MNLNKTLLSVLSIFALPFLLIGQTNFETHVIDMGGMGATSTFFSTDINQDGLPDVVANSEFYFAWFENLGNLAFKKHPIGENGVSQIDAADIDQDGDLDFVIIASFDNGDDSGANLSWVENKGNDDYDTHFIHGTRNAATNYSGSMGSLIIRDVNLDGYPDIIVRETIDDYESGFETGLIRYSVQMFINEQQGEFDRTRIATKEVFQDFAVLSYSFHDFDGDEDLDILITQQADGEYDFFWRENTGDSYSSGSFPDTDEILFASANVSDVDDDGDLDVTNIFDSEGKFYYENDGDGNFSKVYSEENFPSGNSNSGIDLDLDGDLDRISGNEWSENLGNDEFADFVIVDPFLEDKISVFTDMDNDGDLDILVSDRNGTGEFFILINDGDLNFSQELLDGDIYGANYGDVIDLDQDGDLDILATSISERSIFWFVNDGSQNFTRQSIGGSIGSAYDLKAIDYDDDGDLDFIATSLTRSDLYLYRNQGNENFEQEVIASYSSTSLRNVQVADFDNDGRMDFLVSTGDNATIEFFKNEGDGTYQNMILLSLGTFPDRNPTSEFEVVDVNQDGFLDIVTPDLSSQSLLLGLNNGDGTISTTTIVDETSSIAGMEIVDIDEDGDLDIFIASWSFNGQFSWLENNGSEEFAKNIIAEGQYGSVRSSDFDNDGDIDFVTGDYNFTTVNGDTFGIKYWENDGENNFTPFDIDKNHLYAHGLYGVDLDQDSDLDIIALTSTNGINWYENLGIGGNTNQISLECPDDISITTAPGQANAVWTLPVVTSDCTDGFELTQTGGPEFGINLTPGSYLVSYNAFDVCDPENPVTCSFNFVVAFEDPEPSNGPFEKFCIDDGGFEEPKKAFFADLNGDGLEDIIMNGDDRVRSGRTDISDLAWYEKTIDGSYIKRSINAYYVRDAIPYDMDGDGDIDIAYNTTVGDWPGPDYATVNWAENINNEYFSTHLIFSNEGLRNFNDNDLGFNELRVADLNNDGLGDLIQNFNYRTTSNCFNCVENEQRIFFNQGNGNFGNIIFDRYAEDTGHDSGILDPYDFDNDGNLDLLQLYFVQETFCWYKGDGNGGFEKRFFGDPTIVIAIAEPVVFDFDNDGDLDFYGPVIGGPGYYINDGNGIFGYSNTPNFTSIKGVPNFDFDNDGDLDIVEGDEYWYENLGGFDFEERMIAPGLDDKFVSPFDSNNDNYTDLIVTYEEEQIIELWVNDGQGNYAIERLDNTNAIPRDMEEADVDNDGDLDLLVAAYDDGELLLYYNQGNGVFQKIILEIELDGINDIEFSDIDLDGDLDILAVASRISELVLFKNQDGEFLPKETILTSPSTRMHEIETLDINGDEYPDIILTEGQNDLISIWTNNGDGSFSNDFEDTNINPYQIEVADIDGDGLEDFVVSLGAYIAGNGILNGQNNVLVFYRNNGDGSFDRRVVATDTQKSGSFHLVDIDMDGDVDVVSAGFEEDGSLFYYEYVGNFEFRENGIANGGNFFQIASGDYDGDGDIDLFTSAHNSDINGISYFENDGNENFTRSLFDQYFFNGTDLNLIDFDMDGDLDLTGISDGHGVKWWENKLNEIAGNELALSCPEDILQSTTEASIIVSWQDPVVQSDCPEGFSLEQNAGPISGSSFTSGTTTLIEYTLSDECGTTAVTCTFNVNIELETINELSIVCPEDIVIMTSADFATVNWNEPTITSNCPDGFDLETLGDLFPDNQYPIGLHTVELFLTDNCGTEPVSCFFDIIVEQVDAGECPKDLNGYDFIGELDGHRYFLSNEKMNWPAAQAMAKNSGGYLASINGLEENNFISENISELSFIGYSDEFSEGNFSWDSNESVGFINLEGANNQWVNFAYINFWNGGWSLDGPFAERKFILEIDCDTYLACSMEANIMEETCFDNGTPDINDDGYTVSLKVDGFGQVSSGWTTEVNGAIFSGNYGQATTLGPFSIFSPGEQITISINDENGLCNTFAVITVPEPCPGESACPDEIQDFSSMGFLDNSSYYLSNQRYTWAEANAYANENGGYLVSINDEIENKFLSDQTFDIYFIGINDKDNEGSPSWINQDVLSYTNYSSCFFCPSNNEENDFGAMNFWDGSWIFESQFVERRFIMEINCQPTIIPSGIQPRLSESTLRNSEIKIYPNPARERIYISMTENDNEEETISLIDARGALLKNQVIQINEGVNELSIDVSDYPDGIYFLKFSSYNQVRKFFKKGISY